jgi:hypothetical protein
MGCELIGLAGVVRRVLQFVRSRHSREDRTHMRPLRIPRSLLAAALALASCRRDTSLREALDALPRDSAAASDPMRLPDSLPAADTTADESASLPATFPDVPDSTAAAAAPPPAPAPPPAAPPAPAPTGAWTAGVLGAERPRARMTTLTAVRTARHPGFDRVVFEFSGGEIPGYHLEYADRPVTECGSGRAVAMPGGGRLRVRLSPAQAHDERGRSTLPERTLTPTPPSNLLQARTVCDFEGVVEWVLGVRAPNRYRVLELTNPARLVVDVEQ